MYFPILGQINSDANVPPSLVGSYSIAGKEVSNLFFLHLIVILDLPSCISGFPLNLENDQH